MHIVSFSWKHPFLLFSYIAATTAIWLLFIQIHVCKSELSDNHTSGTQKGRHKTVNALKPKSRFLMKKKEDLPVTFILAIKMLNIISSFGASWAQFKFILQNFNNIYHSEWVCLLCVCT